MNKQHQSSPRDPIAIAAEMAFKDARKDGLSISDSADIVAAVIRELLEQREQANATMNREMIHVQSIFGAKTGAPLVDFKYGLEHFTLSVDQAREHAVAILECCTGADMDASVFRWLTLQMGMDATAAATAIGDLRRFRGDGQKEDWRTPEQQLEDETKPTRPSTAHGSGS